MKKQIFRITLGAVAGLLALGATSSKAVSSVSYDLNAPNTALSSYAGPYGTVEVDWTDSTHASITFTSKTVGIYQFLFGASQMADVNLDASSFDVTINSPSTAKSPAGSGNVSTFGNFNVAIDNKNASSTTSTVQFDVTNLSGTWADASSVLTGNDQGYLAAAHIIVIDTTTGGVAVTGFTANARAVPDGGSTMALLGTGLLGLRFVRRKMGKKI